MRWLTSLALVGLATLVVSETPNFAVRRARFANPLIKLAVQPAIASDATEGVAAVAPIASVAAPSILPYVGAPLSLASQSTGGVASVAAPSILPYVGAPQYWGGYGAPNNWYGWNNPAPFWGGYNPSSWSPFGGPYWRPR
ncbi:hypothetical protein KR215_011143, partial [Drosophila sulfurigaster]